MTERGILISFQELRILLYEIGVQQIEGVYMPEHEYTDVEILEILYGMVKSKFISVSEEGFVMRSDIAKIVRIIGRPDRTFIMEPFFCYIADGSVVTCERYWKKKDMLKVQLFTLDSFEKWRDTQNDDSSRD